VALTLRKLIHELDVKTVLDGSVMRYHGVFGEKQLYVSDPKALHYIFVKEYESYVEPEFFYM
jgi:hypothetical protein